MRQSEDVVAEARKEYDAEQEAAKQSSADAAPAVSLADEFADAYTHAEATLRQAREMKYSWTTTAPLLKAASEAAESGDYEKGMSLGGAGDQKCAIPIEPCHRGAAAG